jgi:hypothetical protein
LAGKFGRSPTGGPAASKLPSTSEPKPDVDDAFQIRLSFISVARNDGESELATTTPMSEYVATTDPPACATAFAAADADDCPLDTTRYLAALALDANTAARSASTATSTSPRNEP